MMIVAIHRKYDSAIKGEDSYITVNGNKKKKATTKGWEIIVQ